MFDSIIKKRIKVAGYVVLFEVDVNNDESRRITIYDKTGKKELFTTNRNDHLLFVDEKKKEIEIRKKWTYELIWVNKKRGKNE